MNNRTLHTVSCVRLKLAVAGFLVLASQMIFGQTQPAARATQILATERPGGDGSAVVKLTIPADVQIDSLSASLNGKDVSQSFSHITCPEGICEEATLTTQDGLHGAKNALSVVARRNDGSLVSVRHRFDTQQITARPAAVGALLNNRADAVGALPTLSSFLPPAIAFSTVESGGYTVNKPWIQIGSQNTYPSNPSSFQCQSPSVYSVIVLDRQTLVEKTDAPESSPQCMANGTDLTTYLKTLTSDDLVIVGSNQGIDSDAKTAAHQLDTSAIGGTAYNCIKQSDCNSLPSTTVTSQDIPRGYIAIGVGGAASGSAYENYYATNGDWWTVVPYATGMLVEDVNGNYNYQPSGAVEYTVIPNDTNNSGVSTVTVGTGPGSPYYAKGQLWKTYRPPVSPGQNGFWLLRLQRSTLFSVPLDLPPPPPSTANQDACPQSGASSDGKTVYFNSCGQFYATNVSDPKAATAAYTSLQGDLQNVGPDELVFLVTIGTAGYKDTNGIKLVPTILATAFSALGGTPETLTSLNQSGSTYSFVGCLSCGNSLGGHTVISTSLQASQGQNGYIHGLLQPNLNGLYWPTQASLDQPGSENKPTADFTMQEIGATQPVEWPELSTTQKLTVGSNTADTTAGQNAAYYYISYQLINQHYILGAQGNYIDDIHYYYTGGNNTFLDYHTFDPANLTFPGSTPATCYQWTDPVTVRGALACFTQNDFNAVRAQMHNEILYLTNVLQFMVTGSTNMKDIVASGNGSAALALINAASEVKGSSLQPPPPTPVRSNISNILNLVGNVVSVGAAIATGGASTFAEKAVQDAVAAAGPVVSVVSGSFGIASSVTGGLQTGGGPAPIPGPDYYFETTIGDLSSNALQQQFTAGFDTGLDGILGDWQKLSTIGPKITDSSQTGFQSTNQVGQVLAIQQIGQASQRSFYTALLPVYYSVQHYTGWYGRYGVTNNPDMAGDIAHGASGCTSAWYYSGSNPPSTINYQSRSYFSFAGYTPIFYFWKDYGQTQLTIPAPVDWYLIGGVAQNKSKDSQSIPLIDAQLATTLFDPAQLNIPMDPFLDQGGPMASVWLDVATNGFDGWPPNQTCSLYVNSINGGEGAVGSQGGSATSTALSVPASAILGESATLKATVTTGTGPVTSGTVDFEDGNTDLGQATVDATGAASLTVNSLAVGAHSITAYYLVNNSYGASHSAAGALTVYANDPDLSITTSATTLSVAVGATSSPVNLQVASKWGLAGTVTFACSGLPAGATCAFKPAQASLAAGGTATSALTITSAPQKSELLSVRGVFGLLSLPLSLLSLWRIRKGARTIQAFLCLLVLSVASFSFLAGCSGSSTKTPQTGATSTVLITATVGTVTQTIPLSVTIQ